MARFALAVVIEAACGDEAKRFLAEALREGVRGARPIAVAYVGAACPVGPARGYSTEEIHLLRDGMREIAVPKCGS